MTVLYGGGAVLCREIKVRWSKGIGSLLLLGTAYAVLEEGLMVASFYNPGWQDLGVLGVYGRWLGVNWVWLIELTIYHAIISIAIPVMLVELIYPSQQGKPWLSKRWFNAVSILFLIDIIGGLFLFSAFTGYKPTLSQIGFSLFLVGLFSFLSKKLDPNWARRGNKKIKSPLFLFFTTFVCVLCNGFVFWVLPNQSAQFLHPIILSIIGILINLIYLRYLIAFKWLESTEIHRFSLLAGSLAVLIILAFFQELDKTRPDNTSGMALVGFISIILLLLLRKKIKNRTKYG